MTPKEWKKIRGSAKQPDQIMLSIKADPADSITVRWRTDINIKSGYVLFRVKGTDG